MIPIIFFIVAFVLASIGPGHIAVTALMAPMAMAVAARAKVPAFLMAIMVGHGATSGAVSPVAPTGIIVSGLMADMGMPGYELRMFLNNAVAHMIVAFVGYFAFGGWRLFKLGYIGPLTDVEGTSDPLDSRNWLTLGVIAALLISVLFLGANVGLAAFAGAVILAAFRAADHDDAIRRMPWSVIMMVSGVTVLIGMLERTEGLSLFTSILASFASPGTVTGVIAFVTGLISVYSSTSGVVLPAMLPTIPGLIQQVGGGDALALASSMNVGGHLVDVSPLSTIGALCIAALVPGHEDPRALFNKMLAWGLSMAVVGALLCWVIF
jgi:di/tricarboxylate transporter